MDHRVWKTHKTCRAENGFALVEILAVLAIIGILGAVSVSVFNVYKEKAYCAQIKSDLYLLGILQESYFVENNSYLKVTQGPKRESNMANFRWTDGVILQSSSGGDQSWTAVLGHPGCGDGPYTWDSANGGLQSP